MRLFQLLKRKAKRIKDDIETELTEKAVFIEPGTYEDYQNELDEEREWSQIIARTLRIKQGKE